MLTNRCDRGKIGLFKNELKGVGAVKPSVGYDYFNVMGIAKKSYNMILAPVCSQWEITRNELDVLLFLGNNPGFDRATDIVTYRGMAKSHVSLSVSNLESRGFLVRRFDEADRRTAHLVLTEQGSAIAAQARVYQTQFFSALHRGITEEEFAIWGSITQRVCENIRALEKSLPDDETGNSRKWF